MHEDAALGKIACRLDKIVAINFYGRSGSLFLQSLFDGHPNAITTAGVYFYFLLSFYDRHYSMPRKALLEEFSKGFAAIFDSRQPFRGWGENSSEELGLTRMGDTQNQHLSLDQARFLEVAEGIFKDQEHVPTRRMFFQAIHLAYHFGLGRDLPDDRNLVIVFPHHNLPPKQAAEFSEDFPEAKYLYTIRKPVSSLESLLKHVKGEVPWSFKEILFGGTIEEPSAYERSRAIRIEDLNQEPEKTLKRMCRWLDIPWHQSLLKSTFHGLTWWGDQASSPRTGFSDNQTAAKQYNVFSSFDKFRLHVLLWPKYKAWHYPLSDKCGTAYARLLTLAFLPVPFKPELANIAYRRQRKLRTYLAQWSSKRTIAKALRLFVHWSFLFLLVDYLKLRSHLVRAWLGLIRPKGKVVQLL